MRIRGLIRILSAAVILLGAPLAYGQSSTQATITGRIVDKDGNPMPGVTVIISASSVAMAPAGAVTDSKGNYRISPLTPADDYVLLAEIPGFAKVEVSPINLDPGKTTTQNFTLVPSADTMEKITVTGKGDIVDVASTKTATVFNSEFIEGLPILGRSYQDILTLAPGVTDVDGDGNPNVNGARDTDFQTRVDGANTTDPVSGTFGQNLNLESIAEIEIITTGASAEFSQAQGGFANIITKSGGNEFEGSFKFFFRSDLFDNDGANNADVSDTAPFDDLNGFTDIRPFLTLGGPIVRDRIWYFVSLEWINTETPVNTGTFPVLTTNKGWQNFLKFTWQVNPSNRLSVQGQYDPREFTGLGLGTGVAPESDFVFDQGGLVLTARWTYNINPSVLLETLVSDFDTGIDLTPITEAAPCVIDSEGRCNPFSEDLYTIDINQGTVNGPFFTTSTDTRTRQTVKADLSIFLDTSNGSHNVKTGFEFAREGFTNTATFDSIRFDDITSAGAGLGGGNLSGSINIQEFIPRTQFVEATKDNWGFYIQDSYKPRPNLSINVGMRFDREDANTSGFASFDPVEEAEEFLDLFAIGSGQDRDSLGLLEAFQDASKANLDINGDGLDDLHCRIYDLDGAVFGDGMPDGVSDNFWTYFDGDFDGVVDCNNPFDICIQVPDGQPDGISGNPLCDRLSQDTFDLISVFTKHQFDDTGAPFAGLAQLAVDRDGDGIPAFCPQGDPTCAQGEVLDPDDLPGKVRTEEDFNLVNNNIAPRLSISWDPWANNKTKVFATWSRFFDKLFLATLTPEFGPDPRTVVYNPNQVSLGAAAVPLQTGRFSITQVDREMKTPFTDEFTIGFERELASEWSFSFTYINRKGRDQLQDIDFNHSVQDLNGDGVFDDNFGRVGSIASSDDSGGGSDLSLGGSAVAPDGQPDLFALNPFFNQILRVGNFNVSSFEAYQFTITRRLSRKWQMTSSYVYSEAVGNAENFLSGLGNDPGTTDDEFGPLSFDQTHVVKFNAVTFLPGNQSVGATIQWASGTPFSLIRQRQSADSFGSFFLRTTFPTGQRNDQRNEGAWLINLSYKKNFVFGKMNASIGVEVQNLLNDDYLTINTVDQSQFQGVDFIRDFGRRWQLSAQFHF